MTLEDTIELKPHHVQRLFLDWAGLSDDRIAEVHRAYTEIGDKNVSYSEEAIANTLKIYNRIKKNEQFKVVNSFDSICNGCNKIMNPTPGCLMEPMGYYNFISEEFELIGRPEKTYVPKNILEVAINRIEWMIYLDGDYFAIDWWSKNFRIARLRAYKLMKRIIEGESQ